MKYKLKYSPDARDKLREIKKQIALFHGNQLATKIVSKIKGNIRDLQNNPEKGTSVEALLGIPTSYRFLHIEHNYVFYKFQENTVFVTDIYNEKENFMWKIFGINLRTQDSIEFWGE